MRHELLLWLRSPNNSLSELSAVLIHMFESDTDLRRLQDLLDSSWTGSTEHLKSIIRKGDRTLDAEQVVAVCEGMCTLATATVTKAGEPRISGADGHFIRGRWIIGTHEKAAKARHLRARPGISATYMRGEALGIFVHGRALALNREGNSTDVPWIDVKNYLIDYYGADGLPWSEIVFYIIDPTWMVAYSPDKANLFSK